MKVSVNFAGLMILTLHFSNIQLFGKYVNEAGRESDWMSERDLGILSKLHLFDFRFYWIKSKAISDDAVATPHCYGQWSGRVKDD